MYLVTGFVVVEEFGFDVRKHFDGFIDTVEERDGSYVIQGIEIPKKQIITLVKVGPRAETINMPGLLGESKLRVKRSLCESESADWYNQMNQCVIDARRDIGLEFKIFQNLKRMPSYDIIDNFEKDVEWQMVLFNKSMQADASLRTLNYHKDAIENMYLSSIRAIQKSMKIEDVLGSWSKL